MIRYRNPQRRARPSLFLVVVDPRRRSSRALPRSVEFSVVRPNALAIAITASCRFFNYPVEYILDLRMSLLTLAIAVATYCRNSQAAFDACRTVLRTCKLDIPLKICK